VLYPYYLGVPRLWGLPAVDDQAIGGAIMWIVGGMMYPITLLVLVASFLNEEERLTLQREAKTHRPGGPRGEGMPRADGSHPESPSKAPQEPLTPHHREKET
jgi:hypothetical protein